MALQTADASCRDDSGATYVDCGNGTVTDNRTGLVWLADADCLGVGVDWHTAMEFVAGLSDLPGSDPDDCGLSDGSSPGEWRLPSIAEWKAMVADADGGPGELDCHPAITNDQGIGCWTAPCHAFGFCSFSNLPSDSFLLSSARWSATTKVSAPSGAWILDLNDGLSYISSKAAPLRVWPVRGGQ